MGGSVKLRNCKIFGECKASRTYLKVNNMKNKRDKDIEKKLTIESWI